MRGETESINNKVPLSVLVQEGTFLVRTYSTSRGMEKRHFNLLWVFFGFAKMANKMSQVANKNCSTPNFFNISHIARACERPPSQWLDCTESQEWILCLLIKIRSVLLSNGESEQQSPQEGMNPAAMAKVSNKAGRRVWTLLQWRKWANNADYHGLIPFSGPN